MHSDTLKIEVTQSSDITLVFTALRHLAKRSEYSFRALELALSELIENVLEHAYHADETTPIDLHITFELKACQLQITLREFGAPFDFTPYLSESIDQSSDHSKGFYLIYDLVDTFYFTNLGKSGKQFTLVSKLSNCHLELTQQQKEQSARHQKQLEKLQVRGFQEGDESAVSRLIYQNYDYTYYKPLFYEPLLVKEANANGKVLSFLAEIEGEVIGHFALVPRPGTNSGEVAIAVVHPQYKGHGIMSKMFIKLIEHAQSSGFRSLFGEAIMLHPYSQKANLKKGMHESAVVLGLVPGDIEIEHKLKIGQRSGVLLGYRLFTSAHHEMRVPKRYQTQIETTLAQFDITMNRPLPLREVSALTAHKDEELNLITLQIDADLEAETLTQTIEKTMLEQSAMIYADINLHRIEDIDTLVDTLNRHGFFYSGILFDFYHDEDYLRLQKVTSKEIDIDHLVTYSQFAKALLDYIREDKAAIGF